MRKTAKRVEEEPVESEDASPPKKSKLREKKVTKDSGQVTASISRLPRAAKTRAAAQQTSGNNNVETTSNNAETKKPRAGTKAALGRSNSSADLASMATGKLKKTKSKSAENLNEDEADVQPAKKSRNGTVKATKKTVAKKAGNEGKAKPRGKATEESKPDEPIVHPALDGQSDSAAAQAPLIAKKVYGRAVAKRVPAAEAKGDEKPKKRAPAKKFETSKDDEAEDEEEEEEEEAAKPAKGKKGKANERKLAPSAREEKEVEADDANGENIAEEAADDENEAAKPKRGKKGAVATKRPRGRKANVETAEKSFEPANEDNVVVAPADPEISKEEAKPTTTTTMTTTTTTRIGKKGRAAATLKNRGKKAAPAMNTDDDAVDKAAEDEIDENFDGQEVEGADHEPERVPEKHDESSKNGDLMNPWSPE